MIWTLVLAAMAMTLYVFLPLLDVRVLRKTLGVAFFAELFYLAGHYLVGWPFPTPRVILQLIVVVALGMALGVVFARVWPLSRRAGFERIIRTLLLVIPALGLGIGLQVLLQGRQATQAIYLLFAVSAWLGSGHFVRQE